MDKKEIIENDFVESSGSYETILDQKLVHFLSHRPGDRMITGIWIDVERKDLGIRFQYIVDKNFYGDYRLRSIKYKDIPYTTLIDNYNKDNILTGFTDRLVGCPYCVQIITGDRKSFVKSGCDSIPNQRNFGSYDHVENIYTPIQILYNPSMLPIEEKECTDISIDREVAWALFALNDRFAIRLPYCGSACAPGPDFRRAATIRPIE